MKRPSKPPTFLFEFRDEPHANAVTAWLIAKDGPACSGLLHGTMTADNAKHLVESMQAAGFECRWRVPIGPSADMAASDEVKMEEQRGLFEGQA